jgi:hypothetical protein
MGTFWITVSVFDQSQHEATRSDRRQATERLADRNNRMPAWMLFFENDSGTDVYSKHHCFKHRVGAMYPFERQRYWIDPDKPAPPEAAEATAGPSALAPLSGVETPETAGRERRHRIGKWFYRRAWQRTLRPPAEATPPACWIVFLEPNDLGKQICGRLHDVAHRLVIVTPGRRFKRSRHGQYTIRPGMRDDYDALLAELARRQISPARIVHLCSTLKVTQKLSLDEKLDHCFYSLLFLAQALGAQDMTGSKSALSRTVSIASMVSRSPRRTSLERQLRAPAKERGVHDHGNAAGVIDDSPLLIKSRTSAASVLDAKVKGTLVLIDFRSTTREIHDGKDEFLGWGRLAKGGIEVHEVPSTHYNMVDEPAVMILSEMLRQCLDQDRGSLTPPLQLAHV